MTGVKKDAIFGSSLRSEKLAVSSSRSDQALSSDWGSGGANYKAGVLARHGLVAMVIGRHANR